jgi:hypothetical protein
VTIDVPVEAVWPWLAQIGQIAAASTATNGSRTSPVAGCATRIGFMGSGSTATLA